MTEKLYLAFGGTLLAMLMWAQYTGWCLAQYDRVPNVPNSVRNNPGSYRSHYSNYYVRVGGK